MMKRLARLTFLAIAATGCIDDTDLGDRLDGGSLDGSLADGSANDGATHDGAAGDAGTPDATPPACTDGTTQTLPCGLNDRGTQTQRCNAGVWADEGECNDPDECVDDARSTRPCEVEAGAPGTLPLLCERGRWDEDGACERAPGIFTEVTAGLGHMVGTLESGEVVAWGRNGERQLGDDTRVDRHGPVIASLLTGTSAHGAGDYHSCGILPDGRVRCVGQNGDGQLGDGGDSAEDWSGYSLVAVDVRRVTNAVEVDGGWEHSCARTVDNRVYCWGATTWDQLGENPPMSFNSEANLVGGLPPVAQLAVGNQFNCVRTTEGEVWCWGHNLNGQLGNGTTDYDVARPARVAGLTNIVDVSAGDEHVCAVRDDGAVFCWGRNFYGQLGDGTEEIDRLLPVRVVDLDDAIQVAAGFGHTCALRHTGTVACWGWNSGGQAGVPLIEEILQPLQLRPVSVEGLADVARVVVGNSFSCAHLTNGELWCWGNGDRGERGNGDRGSSATPVRVVAPVVSVE